LHLLYRDKRNNSTTVMSREHWHVGSRPDYITHLALSRSHAEHQGRVPSRPKHDAHMPKHLQPSVIPDLRFEPTYLAKLAVAGPGWKSVVWVTVRDQMISPLLQGALWGAASIFIQPLLQSLTWKRSQPYSLRAQKEGSAAGWLRQWARSLFPDARSGNPSGTR